MKGKYLIISLTLLLLTSIGGIFLYFFLQSPPPEPGTTSDKPFFAPLLSDLGPPLTSDPDETNTSAPTQRFAQITREPVAGYVALSSNTEEISTTSPSVTRVRYVNKATGHIYEYNMATGERGRLDNTTRTNVFRSFWSTSGDHVFIQSLTPDNETITTTKVTLVGTSTPTINLPINITSADVRNNAFAWVRELNSGSVVEVGDFTTEQREVVLESPLSEWRVEWKDDTTLVLYTKPSGLIPGYAYNLDIQTGQLTPLLRGIEGLSGTTDSTGARLAYSRAGSQTTVLRIYSDTDETPEFALTQTLQDKCVWSTTNPETLYCAVPQTIPSATYPDEWYKGRVTFEDTIWVFNSTTGIGSRIYNPKEAQNASLDLINLSATNGDQYLIAQDKINGTLWRLTLE